MVVNTCVSIKYLKRGFIKKEVFVIVNIGNDKYYCFCDLALIKILEKYKVPQEDIEEYLKKIRTIENKILFKDKTFFLKDVLTAITENEIRSWT